MCVCVHFVCTHAHFTVCVLVPSPSGGVQFCSATYRLFKVGVSRERRGRGEGGNGGWGERGGEEGREEEIEKSSVEGAMEG